MLEPFGIKDIIDILLVAFGLYKLYYLVQKSGANAIVKGIIAFIIIWILVSKVFEMRLLGSILDTLKNLGFLVIILLFQDEIRRFLMSLGSNRTFKFVSKLFGLKKGKNATAEEVTPIVLACLNMAKTKTGALIVLEQEIDLSFIEETGEVINADMSTRLIENIFFKNSPLHDGAMIISKGKITAAGCILPVSQNPSIPKQFGLRHRAALGIAEETDAKVIVVSEERGKISFVDKGELKANVSPEKLQELLIASILSSSKE
ncbi:TIGR00159 family protein [Dysgonomonas sp. 216]|uniref:diadenylate cyclase CdaA n=1 Tax=Dysgonomonas sp. 216 TaxID=2302934 RepID=UPI0013D778D6|nr:diadenylate cyclase CdaA [Dysgonomonas sp. 216]NDW19492.1 TIGR00159 family protein [Dysgonomonas sp. 216]